MIELAPGLAAMIFVVLPTVEFDEVVPTVVGVALVVPVEIVVVTVPTVVGIALVVPVEVVAEVVPIVAASTGSVGVPVVAEGWQLVRHAHCDRCECAARYTTPGGSPML